MIRLFSNTRLSTKPFTQLHSSSLLRFLSSDSDPKPDPPPVQPVSYVAKPKEETGSQETAENQTNWTPEDMRYLKNVTSSVSPVSYPKRVAPLPEDRVRDEVAENAEMERERMKIEFARRRIAAAKEEAEEKPLPFPRLIMPQRKEKRDLFDLMDAIKQLKANAKAAFDETVEAHVRLGIPKARSDLIVRGSLTLPHGEKKVIRVAVFAEGSDAEEAQAAGADIVGGMELINEIASTGKINFDKCFTTPKLYPRVAKLARILNRHGLMPDRKQGTVVTNVTRAVKDAKKNQLVFKMDKSSIVHVGLGKVSFSEESLRENIGAFMNALLLAKPAGLKKTSKYAGYVNSFHICSTMGPGLPISIQSVSKAVDQLSRVQQRA